MNKQVHHGIFDLNQWKVPGVLCLKASKSTFELWSDKFFRVAAGVVHGTTTDAKFVSILDCLESIPGSAHAEGQKAYSANVTFHLATIGNRHLDADIESVLAIRFRFDELKSITRESGTGPLGIIHDPDPKIMESLRTHRPEWTSEVKEGATVLYFGGDTLVLPATLTDIGEISFNRGLTGTIGNGIRLEDNSTVTIAFSSPVTIHTASDRMEMLRFFLGLLVGHLPTVERAWIAHSYRQLSSGESYLDFSVELHKPLAHVLSKEDLTQFRIGFSLLDCSDKSQRNQLSTVITNWFCRNTDPERRHANWRFLKCFMQHRSYSTDRIIAAANMFDLLPKTDWPHPKMKDLRKKVKSKAKLILKDIGDQCLPKLNEVIDHAVDCRNHYVHGNQAKLDYDATMPFLTDTLEFVYGTSELIECGWDARRLTKLRSHDHPFVSYLKRYKSDIDNIGP